MKNGAEHLFGMRSVGVRQKRAKVLVIDPADFIGAPQTPAQIRRESIDGCQRGNRRSGRSTRWLPGGTLARCG